PEAPFASLNLSLHKSIAISGLTLSSRLIFCVLGTSHLRKPPFPDEIRRETQARQELDQPGELFLLGTRTKTATQKWP
ncbi:MAG: hypothetical protein H7835_20720, partial [Magnetococcus sp. XQGC-1]